MRFIDTHVHFTDRAFAEDAAEAIDRAAEAGVDRFLLPDIDKGERPGIFALAARYPGRAFPMVGLYPGSVGPDWEAELDDMARYREKGPVAIGEIGLDYHYGADTADLQKAAFAAQLRFAAQWDLPVNIHLRDATEDFFRVLEECRHLGLRGNLHAFSGSYETFSRLQRYGDWYVGIGGVVTFKNSRLPEAVSRIPLDRILLETDSPYLTPTPYRGRRNESAYIPLIAAKVAQIKGVTIEEVAAVTTAGAEKLFRL